MSLKGTYSVIISALGISIQGGSGADTIEAQQGIDPVDKDIPAAKAVSAWVKTDANTADGTLANGHGLASGKVDVFWDAGYRYGVDATIAGNAIGLDGGAGDDFPESADTTVVVSPANVIDVSFDGDNLVLIGAILSRNGLLVLRDAAGAVVGAPQRLSANMSWGWATGRGPNPLTGNAVASGTISNASTVGTANFKLTGLQYPVS